MKLKTSVLIRVLKQVEKNFGDLDVVYVEQAEPVEGDGPAVQCKDLELATVIIAKNTGEQVVGLF